MAKKIRKFLISLVLLALFAGGLYYFSTPWGFYREIPEAEAELRMGYVRTAEAYLGVNEADGSHRGIVDLYNGHEPLARDYVVQYTDSWCSTFASAMAIEYGITGIIPTECGCERQIGLFQDLGRWEEKDGYIPEPGDLIFFDWDENGLGDSRGWADHVGIVVGVKCPFLKAIEGNKDDFVSYHYVFMGDPQIRGYGLPDYVAMLRNG